MYNGDINYFVPGGNYEIYVMFVHEIWTIPKIQVEIGKLYTCVDGCVIDEKGDPVRLLGHPLFIVFTSDDFATPCGNINYSPSVEELTPI